MFTIKNWLWVESISVELAPKEKKNVIDDGKNASESDS